MTLPPFVPIKHRFPHWLTAKAMACSLLPERLVFRLDPCASSVIGIDQSWSMDLIEAAPEEDRLALVGVVLDAISASVSVIPLDRFERFYRQPATTETMHRMSCELLAIDREREKDGAPTTMQILRHVLGVEPAPGSVLVEFLVQGGAP